MRCYEKAVVTAFFEALSTGDCGSLKELGADEGCTELETEVSKNRKHTFCVK